MLLNEKTMKSEKIYDGKIVNLRIDTVELPDKKYSKREIIEHPGSVAIIALTEDNEVLLIEQYRKAVESVLLEIPAGKIEVDEEPNKTAIRELEEETGYRAKKMEYLLEIYTSPGFTNERIYIFLAKEIEKVTEKLGTEGENLRLKKIKLDEVMKEIRRGQIMDSKTILALLYLEKFLEG